MRQTKEGSWRIGQIARTRAALRCHNEQTLKWPINLSGVGDLLTTAKKAMQRSMLSRGVAWLSIFAREA